MTPSPHTTTTHPRSQVDRIELEIQSLNPGIRYVDLETDRGRVSQSYRSADEGGHSSGRDEEGPPPSSARYELSQEEVAVRAAALSGRLLSDEQAARLIAKDFPASSGAQLSSRSNMSALAPDSGRAAEPVAAGYQCSVLFHEEKGGKK